MRGWLILASGLLATSSCLAAEWREHWTASSTTALSITGDVTLRTSAMVFSNGVSLPIQPVRNISFTDDIGKTGPATIYRITRPSDPTLLRGNTLCGAPVTFVVIWHTQPLMPWESVGRAFAAYSGTAEPAPAAKAACAIYRYGMAK